MIIRCERCSTLYELDESLLSPDGSPVQCTRCQSVFTARPPRAAAPDPALAPAAPAPAASTATPSAAASAADPARPARPGPSVYKPPTPQAPPAAGRPGRSGGGPRGAATGTVGAFEARAKRSGRLRRLVAPAVAALVLLAAGLGGWAAWRRRPDTEGLRLAAEAAARLALDDSASLSRALQLYDALLARSPSRHDAEANRALARLLMASAQQEEADPFGEQLAANAADRERLLREHPPGSEDALRTLTVEAGRLEAELAPRRKAAEALAGQAAGELRTLAAGPEGEALAARGQVVAAALAGDRAEVSRLAPLARSAGPAPWADLAEAWLEARPEGNRQQAVARLSELIRARPELLRARFLLARVQVATGHREEALATLAALLAANPRHERAQRLKAMLSAAPPPQPVAAAPQPAPPPPRPAAARPAAPAVPAAVPASTPAAAPSSPAEAAGAPTAAELEPPGPPPVQAPPQEPTPAPTPPPPAPPKSAPPPVIDPFKPGGP